MTVPKVNFKRVGRARSLLFIGVSAAVSQIGSVQLPKKSAPIDFALAQAQKISVQLGYILIDVELVKEATGRFLRFYIDKEGGVSLDDCEVFHKRIQPLMEKVDYDYMEVSSPGVDRPLKKPADFERAMGTKIELKLYKPLDGTKLLRGTLAGFSDGFIEIAMDDGTTTTIEQKQVALAKPCIEFSEEDLMDDISADGGEE